VKVLEAADAALGAESMRLTIERGSEARVSILQLADPEPRKD